MELSQNQSKKPSRIQLVIINKFPTQIALLSLKQWVSQYIIMPKFELGKQIHRNLEEIKPDPPHRESQVKFKLNRQNIIKKCHVDLHEKYVIGDKIGSGSFGEVYRVQHKQLNITRALKIIAKTPESSSSHNSYEELEILKKLDHPNVLKVYEYFQSETQWFIITEYFQGKELFDEIVQEKRLTERKAALIFAEICKAVAYIHAHSIVHRDIKPENILVRKFKKNNFSPDKSSPSSLRQPFQQFEYQIKLIDWGLGSQSIKQLMRKCGTPEYCAPQILEGSYGYECDLWSLGVLLYVMLVGRFPFKGANVHETLELVRRAKLSFKSKQWEEIGPEPKYLISCLMRKEPHLRKKASQVLKSDWILYYLNQSKSHQSLEQLQNEQKQLKQTLMRLKEVTIDNKFQAVVINFIHNYVSAEEKQKKLKKQFELLDENKDGVLSYEQLLKGYQSIYPYLGACKLEQIVFEIFKNIDLDGSGQIQYSEFITFATKIQKKFTEKQLREVFNLLDEDGNGRINKKQIGHILMYEKGAQSQEFDEIIDQIDLDGDGSINFDEFIKNINDAAAKVIKQEKMEGKKGKNKQVGEKTDASQPSQQQSKRVTRSSARQQQKEKSKSTSKQKPQSKPKPRDKKSKSRPKEKSKDKDKDKQNSKKPNQ